MCRFNSPGRRIAAAAGGRRTLIMIQKQPRSREVSGRLTPPRPQQPGLIESVFSSGTTHGLLSEGRAKASRALCGAGLYGGAAGLHTSVAASDPTEGLWARSEAAAELLPGAILTLHPAPRRSPRGSNQSVFLMLKPLPYAPRTTPATCLKCLLTEVDIWR